jgi:hypothetical protein
VKHFRRFGLVVVLASAPLFAANTYTAAQAAGHIGEQATVCGVVASTHFAPHSRGQPTFLNLDKPYPGQIFTGVIWDEDRVKFGSPERTYEGKTVCFSGSIRGFREAPEIIARRPSQIAVK